MYYDLGKILPFQRLFNFINGPRSIGKTYTTLKWLIKKAIEGKQFGYIVQTRDELKEGAFEKGLVKVIQKEYPNLDIKFDTDCMYVNGEASAYAFALTRARKEKRNSYPNIYYLIFDEYTIEEGTDRYVNGFNEPELFMTMYHTIDRDEERVKCFFLGNNTSYYNPYHLYPAFGLPKDIAGMKPGSIYTNPTTLFHLAQPDNELLKKFSESQFRRAISGTRYGDYASEGVYRDDGYQPIMGIPRKTRYIITLHAPTGLFGVYYTSEGHTIISDKTNPAHLLKCSLVRHGMKEGYGYIRPRFDHIVRLFRTAIGNEQLFYTSMGVKNKVEPYLLRIL